MSGKGNYKVPYDGDGNLLHYPERWYMNPNSGWHLDRVPGEWRDNEPFDATLTLNGIARGRSAAYFHWKDTAGHLYPMFMTDLETLLRQNVVEYGVVREGTWAVKKRGQNYGIALAGT